jgi:hypothetical protein
MKKSIARAAALLAILTAAGVAVAASPESGKVSTAAPKFTWTGEIDQSYPQYTAMQPQAPENAPCESPGCDTFTLEVTDGAGTPLEFAIEQPSGFVGLRITHPDGTVTMEKVASESGKPAKFSVPKAAVGSYTLAITNNSITPVAYKGTALLKVPSSGPAPEPGATATPTPAAGGGGGGGTTPPAPQPAGPPPATTMSVAAGRASAKKLKRAKKIVIQISVSAPVTGVVAKVQKGRKALATGKLARVDSIGKITVKLRKPLKKGSYRYAITGKDAQGRAVNGTATLKVSK